MVISDHNAKCCKEVQYSSKIKKKNLNGHNNNNKVRIISFATSNEIVMVNCSKILLRQHGNHRIIIQVIKLITY